MNHYNDLFYKIKSTVPYIDIMYSDIIALQYA